MSSVFYIVVDRLSIELPSGLQSSSFLVSFQVEDSLDFYLCSHLALFSFSHFPQPFTGVLLPSNKFIPVLLEFRSLLHLYVLWPP